MFKITASKRKIIGPVILTTAAMIWGLSFVAQSQGMKYIEGFTFNGIRMLMGSIVLIPFIIFRAKKNPKKYSPDEKKSILKTNIKGILSVGLMLFIGSNLQQFAFNYTEVGKVGFMTALYMLLVPVFGLFLKKHPPFTAWIGTFMGLCGLYLLSIGTGFSIKLGKGEILSLTCAVAFAIHILLIDYYSDKIDCIVLSCGQFFVTGVLSCICMLIFEHPNMGTILQAYIPLLYTGIMSCGVAFTFQVIGQKYTEPALASMLLCLESVFSVFFGFIILHQNLLPHEYIGCAIMFVAILIAQIPKKSKNTIS